MSDAHDLPDPLRKWLEVPERIEAALEGLTRQIRLLDAPGAELYTKTVKEILEQEFEHAGEHLGGAQRTRARRGC